jgi:hypothetical protein
MITAETHYSQYVYDNSFKDKENLIDMLKEYGKLCAEEALKRAAKNAKSLDYIDFTNTSHSTKVNKDSILNTKLDFIT